MLSASFPEKRLSVIEPQLLKQSVKFIVETSFQGYITINPARVFLPYIIDDARSYSSQEERVGMLQSIGNLFPPLKSRSARLKVEGQMPSIIESLKMEICLFCLRPRLDRC